MPGTPSGRTTSLPRDGGDRDRLRALFGPGPAATNASPGRSDGPDGPWPRHNYNDAYDDLERLRPSRRRSADRRGESELWEIQDLLDEPARSPLDGPEEPADAPAPWPMHRRNRDMKNGEKPRVGTLDAHDHDALEPQQWLTALDGDEVVASATEARLVRTLWGDPAAVRAPLFDTTDVLYAKDPRHGSLQRGRAGARTAVASTTASGTTDARRGWFARLLRNPRALVIKGVALVLGLKIGVAAGFFAATLL